MVRFHPFVFTRRALIGAAFLGAVALAPAASATASRAQACGIDEDCPSGSYCAGMACVALESVGATCDRDAACASGLCFGAQCGDLQIDTPTDGDLTNEPKLVVAGRAPAGAPVVVGCDQTHDLVVADETGKWVWIPSLALPNGSHVVFAETGSASRQVVLDVDTNGPVNAIVSPLPATVTSDGQVEMRGQMEAGARLLMLVDGVEAMPIVDEHGEWTHLHWLGNGWHQIQTRAIDAAGNVSDASVDFAVDLQAPTVKIQAPNDNAVYAEPPEIMNGRAEPGSKLHIVGHGVDAVLDVADSGAWSLLLPRLADGTYTFVVDVTDNAGWHASDSVTMTIDSVRPGLAFTTNLDQATILETRPAFRGTTDPECEVVLVLDGHRVGEVLSGADGRWSVELERELAAGIHDFAVTATDRAGNKTHVESWFLVDLSAPDLSIVRERNVVEGAPVVLAGQTERWAAIEARCDGRLVATGTADRKGYWTVSFEAEVGPHEVSIIARDMAGHATEGIVDVTVDAAVADGGCSGAGASSLAAALAAVAMVLVRMRRTAAAKA